MDFEEYLWASGEKLLAATIRACFANDTPLAEPLHEKALDYYRRYLCIGGMPEATADLIAQRQDVLLANRNILDNLRTAYLGDMNKYVTNKAEAIKIEAIYRSIPAQLGNTGHKFRYATVRTKARGRDYQTALNWLISSSMVQTCNLVETPVPPLNPRVDFNHFKVFFNDVGLLTSAAGVKPRQILLDQPFTYKGALVENYVANQLTAARRPLRYWRQGNNYEIDFLLETDSAVVPLEVKAGSAKKSPSLNYYRKTYQPPLAYRLRQANFGATSAVKSIPLYAAFCLDTP